MLKKTSVTGNGQKITYPLTDKAEVTAMIVDLPPGAETGWHKHPVPVYAYVISGNLTVELEVPTTTEELLQSVKDGKILVSQTNDYYNYGIFTGAFGGKLMDDTGKCTADQGGFADALDYMKALKDAGALFNTSEAESNTAFQEGKAAYIVSGPWMLGTFKDALGDKLGVVPFPAGPGGPATPLTGIDGWYVNPNSPNQAAAVDLALFIFGKEGAKIYADVAGDPMGRTDIEVSDPMIKNFIDIANAGFPRPQSKEFGGWWGAFNDAITKVLEGQTDSATAVKDACAAMDTANGK